MLVLGAGCGERRVGGVHGHGGANEFVHGAIWKLRLQAVPPDDLRAVEHIAVPTDLPGGRERDMRAVPERCENAHRRGRLTLRGEG